MSDISRVAINKKEIIQKLRREPKGRKSNPPLSSQVFMFL